MIVEGSEGERAFFKPGCGGLQGDGRMPQQFRTAYSTALEGYISTKLANGLGVLGKDPITGITVEVSTTVFADGCSESRQPKLYS